MYLTETSAVDCSGNPLPSYAGKFTFLLPATTPAIFCINIKLRSEAGINNCGAGELLDESQSCIFTHFEPNNLFDYWDGHSLPALDLPFAKKQLVGEFLVYNDARVMHVVYVHVHTCTCTVYEDANIIIN